MAGTIRRNDDNSAQAIRRATITSARRLKARGRQEETYLDSRAILARTSAQSGR